MHSTPTVDDEVHGIGFGAFTVVDVETTGLQAATDRVVSVAALRMDVAGHVEREFHTLVDPGCDPGPVHIHGLTADRLRGVPRFEDVRAELPDLLDGQVMVAHNARFDYGFLAREFDRHGGVLPVPQRMCTLALARRVAPPTPDCRLATLARHYGVESVHAHDALDDTRVLARVLPAWSRMQPAWVSHHRCWRARRKTTTGAATGGRRPAVPPNRRVRSCIPGASPRMVFSFRE